jgi:thymidylate synthase (FAD)
MTVKLVSFTVPTIDELPLDSDVLDLIAYCARVSNPSNQANSDTSEKLIEYLLKHKHFSPFEMADVTLEINTTRDIARQILRHRSFSFQEFSQRYADPTKDLSFTTREARLQDQKNRQNSIDTEDAWLQQEWERTQQDVIRVAEDAYKWAIDKGIAKEVARAVLPEGLTMSRMYMKGSIRSWLHYIEVRTDPTTQKEHREIAVACANVISEIFPMIMNSVHSSNELPTEFGTVDFKLTNAKESRSE